MNDIYVKRCKDCRFWGENQWDHDTVYGFCRVKPPKIDRSTGLGVWPQTDPNAWCGEMREKGDVAL